MSEPPSAASDKDALGTITSRAQAEAVRRYPAIGLKGSPENEIFLARFNRLKAERPEFFEDEEWPIYLAEGLAKEQGSPEGYRTIVNTGRIGRQDVMHLHVHVIGGPKPLGVMLARNPD